MVKSYVSVVSYVIQLLLLSNGTVRVSTKQMLRLCTPKLL